MKKIIYVLLFVFLLTGCGKKNNNIPNTYDIQIKDIEYNLEENVNVKLDKFYYQDSYTTVNLIITNNNNIAINIGRYIVYVYDKNDNLIGMFNPTLDTNIPANSSTNQMFSVNDDLRKADKIDYEFNNVTKIE